MIQSFQHKGLKKFYDTGSHQGIRPEHVKRLRLIIARLDASLAPQDMALPGFDLHALKGKYKGFWGVSVSGNWRIIFRFEGSNAVDVDVPGDCARRLGSGLRPGPAAVLAVSAAQSRRPLESAHP